MIFSIKLLDYILSCWQGVVQHDFEVCPSNESRRSILRIDGKTTVYDGHQRLRKRMLKKNQLL